MGFLQEQKPHFFYIYHWKLATYFNTNYCSNIFEWVNRWDGVDWLVLLFCSNFSCLSLICNIFIWVKEILHSLISIGLRLIMKLGKSMIPMCQTSPFKTWACTDHPDGLHTKCLTESHPVRDHDTFSWTSQSCNYFLNRI